MALRFYRRIKLTKKVGLNINKKSISPSYRGHWGSISKRGVSIKTGIKGLSYRSSWTNPIALSIAIIIIAIKITLKVIILIFKLVSLPFTYRRRNGI